jgi:hypothetical protein
MEINHLKLNDREYLLRKDEWIRRFEDLESNEVTAFYNVVFEKVDGRIVGFHEEEKNFYLGDEKLNQIIFRADDKRENQAFEDIKKWLNEHIEKEYKFFIQLH